jgi:hypothetical protein
MIDTDQAALADIEEPLSEGLKLMTEQNKKDDRTLKAMELYGGSFMKQLAQLYRLADCHNQSKIKHMWAHEWAQYTIMAKQAGDRLD